MLDKSNLIPIWICWKSDLGCQSKWNPSASFYLLFSLHLFFLSPPGISVYSLSHSLSHQTPSVPKRMTQCCELDHTSSHHNTPATLQTHYATPWLTLTSFFNKPAQHHRNSPFIWEQISSFCFYGLFYYRLIHPPTRLFRLQLSCLSCSQPGSLCWWPRRAWAHVPLVFGCTSFCLYICFSPFMCIVLSFLFIVSQTLFSSGTLHHYFPILHVACWVSSRCQRPAEWCIPLYLKSLTVIAR